MKMKVAELRSSRRVTPQPVSGPQGFFQGWALREAGHVHKFGIADLM